MNLVRSISTVGGFTIASRLFGFVREILTASLLGAGPIADAFFMSIKLPSFFRRIFAEGAFNSSFVPLFARILAKEGKDEACVFGRQILTLLAGALFCLVLLAEIFLPTILPFLLPGFASTPERLIYVLEFTRITFPFILFISLTALYSGVLNSINKFSIAASSPLVGNIMIVVMISSLFGAFFSPGYIFAWAITLCGVVQWLWVWIPAYKRGFGLQLVWPRFDKNIVHFFKIFAPAAFGSGVVQINLLLGAFIASWLPAGAISYFNYADRLNQLPLSVIGVAVSTALLPILSRYIQSGEQDKAQQIQVQALEFSMFLTLPAAMALIFLAEPFIMVVFERGAFTPHDTAATALTLQALACGLPAYVLIKVFSSSFFARQDTFTPVCTACAGIVVDIVLSLLLMGSLHQVGIAFATAAAAWVNAFWLGFVLWRQGYLFFDNRLKKFIGRMTLTCAGTILLLKILYLMVAPLFLNGEIIRSIIVASLVSLGAIGFIFLSHFIGALRFQELKFMFSARA